MRILVSAVAAAILADLASAQLAATTPYGGGCPPSSRVAVYEQFPGGTFDLSNMGLLFLPATSGSYVIVSGPNLWFTGLSNNLGLADDSTRALTCPFPFPHSGGTTSVMEVSSNGYLWLGANTANGCCAGSSATFLSNAMARIAACWTDLNPGVGGGVYADFDAATGEYVITWSQVPEYNNVSSVVNMQIALQASGIFELRYQSCAITSSSHTSLTGYSMGSVTPDPGNRNLSSVVSGPIITNIAGVPLGLSASARPVLGTSLNLVTANIPQGTLLGASLLGRQRLGLPVSLASAGAPGCFQYINPQVTVLFVPPGPTASAPVNVPNSAVLAGVRLQSQSASLSSGFNTLGVLFSNGLELLLNPQ